MDNKEKQQNEEKNLQDQKNEEKKQSDPVDQEIIDKIISELEDKYDLKRENIKILKIQTTPYKPKIYSLILRDIFFWFLDLLLIFALQGYFNFFENNLLKIILFSICFYLIESLSRYIITKYYQKIIFYSFGLIMIPVTIIAIILAHLIVDIEFTNSNKMIGFLMIFMFTRILIRFVFMRKEIVTIVRGRRR